MLALALLLGCAHQAAAQQGAGDRNGGPAALTVASGTQATLVFRLTNRTGAPLAVNAALTLPPGWRLVIPDGEVTIAPRGTGLKLLRIAVPSGAGAGTYALRYAAARAADSVLVTVPLQRRVVVSVWAPPRFAVAGEAYATHFVVRNAGNAPADLQLRLSASDGYSVRLDSGAALLHLAPSEQRVVRATVVTDSGLTRWLVHRVQLDAAVAGDTAACGGVVSTVEVVARRVASGPRFRSLPAELLLLVALQAAARRPGLPRLAHP